MEAGLGTIWRNNPSERMITMLLTNAAWTSPRPPHIPLDFLAVAVRRFSLSDDPQKKWRAERGQMLRSTFPTMEDLAMGPQ
jgi:hypothetical protein